MKTRTILFLCALAVLALVAVQPAQAVTYTWTQTAGVPYNWDNSGAEDNWGTGAGGAFPNALDDTANVNIDLVGNQTINLNQAITIGTLNMGDTSGAQTLTIAPNGGSLTFDVASGNAALTKVWGCTGADTISSGIILNDNLNITNNANAGLTISGGVTGTADLTLRSNPANRVANGGPGNTGITLSTTAVNNSGRIINAGTGGGGVGISAAIGSNVTEIRQDSNTSQLSITGGITVNAAGTTLTSNGFQAFLVSSGAIGGAGNLVINNNSLYASSRNSAYDGSYVPNGIAIGAGVNNTGTITNSGTGAAMTQISGVIGANVTDVIQNSAGSNLLLFGATNAYTGSTQINAGILGVGNAGALRACNEIT